MPASQPWCSSVEQCSIQCQQLQQKAILHNIQYPEVLVPVTWAVLQAGTTICLFAAVAALVSLLWQRAADKARFRARELQLQASCRGTREEALNLGSLAALWAKQNRALTGQNNLLSQEVLAHREAQQQLQAAASTTTVTKSNHGCQTCDDLDDVLAPTSPKLVGEAASPCGEPPQLHGEASMPQLQDLVAAAADSDAARCNSDQCHAGTAAAAATSGASAFKVSSPSKLQLQDAQVQDIVQFVAHARGMPLATIADAINQLLAEQGVEGRLEVQQHKVAAASSSGGLFSAAGLVSAGKPGDQVAAADQQQLRTPRAGTAVQQQGTSPLSGDGANDWRSSEYVTHDQLSIALLRAELDRTKEENILLKSENKVLQQQSPSVTPLVPSSAYINRTRGSAGTPSPFNHAFPGQLGSVQRFSPPSNAFLLPPAPRSGSLLDASSAAASSSCFRGPAVPDQQLPGSVGSTRHSPQGQGGATPCTAPGSATSSASRRAVVPLPMQPLEPAGSPVSPMQWQQQPQDRPAAKALAEAINTARVKTAQAEAAAVNRRKEAEARKATTPPRT
ncbi:hypothetical protein OEZ86_011930 [Tetradesmus obliquus]|nr:hypothetical protein OEZ86_011930 [Tetradesmus obliquus]